MNKLKTVLRETPQAQHIKKIYNKVCRLYSLRYRNCRLEKDSKEAIKFLNSVHPCPKNANVPMIMKKERMLDLSIIIPAHNVEKYVNQCVDSILDQKVEYNYEVIIIENASSDKTMDALGKYAANSKVKILRSERPDPSAARNIGLRESKGRYIMFVDSDDYLVPGILEQMMHGILDYSADIAVCGFEKLEGGAFYKYPAVEKETVWTETRDMMRIYGFAWGKIYKWELFDNVCFPEGLWYEDTIIHMEIFPRAKKMIVLPALGLVYRRNPGSITACHEKTVRCLDTLWVMQAILQKRHESGLKCDSVIYEELLKHFTEVSWIRIRRQSQEIKEAFFCAAAYCMERERRCIENNSLSPELKKLDNIFREKKEKLWESYCKYNG